jgi:sortase (surface protein transpeptidase)
VVAQSRRIRLPVAVLFAGLLLAGGAAVGYSLTRPPNHDYGTVPPASVSRAAATAPSPVARSPSSASRQPASELAVGVVQVPVRLRIPAIGVDAPVLPTGVQAGGALAIPPDPADVGWWAAGAFPGEPTGAVILAGHIDSAASGPGALFRLQQVRPGAAITVTANGHVYRYRVAALRAYAKNALPAAAIFGQQVSARLVIVSCGGPFDAATGHYLENIVAYAVPVGGH